MSEPKPEQNLELEISLEREKVDGEEVEGENITYEAELRFCVGEAEIVRNKSKNVVFDFRKLKALRGQWVEYGRLLGENLLGSGPLHDGFYSALNSSLTLNKPLRFRLAIGEDVPRLHSLVWEVLCDPKEGKLLSTREHFLFHRFVTSPDWRFVERRPSDTLRALVAIANPSNIGEYFAPDGTRMAPIDVEKEAACATEALGDLPVTILGKEHRTTLDNITDHLREGFDILYLVCHGAVKEGQSLLYLESDEKDGKVKGQYGDDLVTRLGELTRRPRLIVLASCQSAGSGAGGDDSVVAALGPRLAAAGVPAVIAMQGKVTRKTAHEFISTFFREVRKSGRIDAAVSAARGAVREEDDWWMPVLFMSLKQGRLMWYQQGFRGPDPQFRVWDGLLEHIENGNCTPILGPELIESMTGSARQVARDWADRFKYPVPGEQREELPIVAQFLTARQRGDEFFARYKLKKAIREGILRHYGQHPQVKALAKKTPLQELLSVAGKIRRNREAAEPHEVLAKLDLPVYLTTNPDRLLCDALEEEGRHPQVAFAPNRIREPMDQSSQLPKDFVPTAETPLVYYLYGSLDEIYSLVVTQDDYFDFLIHMTQERDRIPEFLRERLVDTCLLFLGFRVTDWKFRALLRLIMNQEGSDRLTKPTLEHVAVQVDPGDFRTSDPDRLKEFLDEYFNTTEISVYWGGADDFLKELSEKAGV